MSDAKEQVKAATTAALTATFAVNGNRDIMQFLPALIGCIARPVSAGSLSSWKALDCGTGSLFLPCPAIPSALPHNLYSCCRGV